MVHWFRTNRRLCKVIAKFIGQNVCPLTAKPTRAGLDIGLFRLIQLALRRDVLILETAKPVRIAKAQQLPLRSIMYRSS